MPGTRRANGEGSIYFEVATGRWRGAVTLPDGTRQRVSAKTQKACRAQLRALLADVEDGVVLEARPLTVGGFLDDGRTNVAPTRARVHSPNTVGGYRWAIDKHLTPALGSAVLTELTPEDVEAMLRVIAAKGMARNSLVRVRATLVLALTDAERRSKVARNVAHGRRCRSPARRRRGDR